jgi:transposase
MEKSANKQPTIEELEALNAKLQNQLDELTAKYEWLLEKYRLKVKQVFGRSREMVDGQIILEGVFDEAESEADTAIPDPSYEEATKDIPKRPTRYKGQKEDKFGFLPVERVEYELPEGERSCVLCEKPLPKLAPVVSRRIDVIPAQIRVIEDVRNVYAGCKCCEDEREGSGIVNAPMPERAIPRSIATESTIAYVIAQKYQFGLPLHRQEAQWQMLDINISRQTMANWVILSTDYWLRSIYERMHQLLLQRDIIMADESTLQVLKEKGRPATSNSYMWLYRSGRDGPPIVLFDYQTTRAAKHPERFLGGFAGYLCSDGYAAYYNLPSVTNCSCWSHARRKFFDALKALPKNSQTEDCAAFVGVQFCDKLFDVERELRDKTSQERFEGRLQKSEPILVEFKEWLDYMKPRAAKKTQLGTAVNYCLKYWVTLCSFMKDGRLEVDNNRSERDIKLYVTGRKGWLFSNTPGGATASAIAYSLVLTARENHLKPYEYIKFLLESLPNSDVKDQEVLDSFLPWSASIPESCKIIVSVAKPLNHV